MQPGLRVDHRQGCDRVPGSVPDDLLPTLALDVCFIEYLEAGLSTFEQRAKCR